MKRLNRSEIDAAIGQALGDQDYPEQADDDGPEQADSADSKLTEAPPQKS